MKLVQLSSSGASFKTLSFRPEGLTLIVGDGSASDKHDGSSNGVGKTLALGLVHHCLAAKQNKKLSAAVPDWRFCLDFQIGPTVHRIERSGDSKYLALDERSITLSALRTWLDQHGPFRLSPVVPRISFRSLFSRFARWHRGDCVSPLLVEKEQPFDALVRSLYLLGADTSLATNKRANKLERDALGATAKSWRNDQLLHELFRAGAQPKLRSEHLDREILRLKEDLARFKVAEDYRAIELRAGQLTQVLRDIETQQAVLRFQLEGIERSLETQPDIDTSDLLALYDGLQSAFKPEALKHFQAVETFHQTLAANRKARLEQDRLWLKSELSQKERRRHDVASERDDRLSLLQGKRALDEYAALANHVAALEEEKRRVDTFLELSAALQRKGQEIRERQVEEDRLAAEYTYSQPLSRLDGEFAELAATLYPQLAAGIVLESNVGDNQSRYDLTVQIEGDDSDGINAARILCFDWLILTRGANHNMDFLWHDNRLFADMDPRPRAAWFDLLTSALPSTGKQYIASINTENFSAMKEHLEPDTWAKLNTCVKLILRGDDPTNKLLGIQFAVS